MNVIWTSDTEQLSTLGNEIYINGPSRFVISCLGVKGGVKVDHVGC